MDLVAAFPSSLQPAALRLSHALRWPSPFPLPQGFHVQVQGENLCIPYRVYGPNETLQATIEAVGGEDRLLALCWGTRHHDGHIREACLRRLITNLPSWAAVFVVQLLGEYVDEIVELIAEAMDDGLVETLAAFAQENPQFLALTRRRARSYWDCYHRRRFPCWQAYPALQVLDRIEAAAQAAVRVRTIGG